MVQIGRNKVLCFIVTGFLFKIGLQFYLDGPKQIADVDQSTPKSANNVINERYQLFESYFHDSLSDIDPLFKRILFWNDVNLTEFLSNLTIHAIFKNNLIFNFRFMGARITVLGSAAMP